MTSLRSIDHDAGMALFETADQYVVVDTNKRDVVEVRDSLDAITASAEWLRVGATLEYPEVWKELAEAAVTALDVQESEIEHAERTFKIPNAVKVEAQQAVDWVNGFNRGKSVIGLILANKLLNEKELTASEVVRLNRYFSRISKRSLNDGWTPGQQGYPTNERIRFAMRGGEAGKAWVEKIITRHGLTASGEIDGNKPHEYQDDAEMPGSCLVCGRPANASVHALVAGAFEYDPTCEYFGVGVSPDETLVTGLLMLRSDGTWQIRKDGFWEPTTEPDNEDIVIMLDEESAYRLAEILDDIAPEDPSVLPFELATINPHEAALAALALEEDDAWEMVDRIVEAFDIYDSTERSINAKKQNRAPGGRFGETPDAPEKEEGNQQGKVKARLPEGMPLVPNIAARIQEYLAANPAPAPERAPDAKENSLDSEYVQALIDTYGDTNSGRQELADEQPGANAYAARPLYLALVDKVDTEAVLDLVSLMPGNPPVMWKRDGGAWVQAPEILAALQGTQPPPVVELTDDSVVADVIKQVDESTGGETEEPEAAPTPGATPQGTDGATGPKPDANPDQQRRAASTNEFVHPELDMLRTWSSDAEKEKYAGKGYALPDGSFPIPDVNHLKKAIKAHGRAKDKAKAKKHIMKRARALKRVDLIPEDWKANSSKEFTLFGPHGQLLDLNEFAGGADRNRGNAEELRKYWTRGKGGLKIRWNTPGDMTRCMRHLRKYLGVRAPGYCALRHREMTGMWPGDRKNLEQKG